MKWRVVKNKWNLAASPWSEAVGIEEVDEDMVAPNIVCWLTRGWEDPIKIAQDICDQHNALLEGEKI